MRPWTMPEVALMRELRRDGLTLEQIAEKLGRSFAAVANRSDARQPGRSRRKLWSVEETADLERLLIHVVREHSQRHGRSISSIRNKAMNLLMDIRQDDVEAA